MLPPIQNFTDNTEGELKRCIRLAATSDKVNQLLARDPLRLLPPLKLVAAI